MAIKIIKTLNFPGSSDSYQVNAIKFDGKISDDFALFKDVTSLPTSNIKSNCIYRLYKGTFVQNQLRQSDWTCNIVTTLPEFAAANTSQDIDKYLITLDNEHVNAYYQLSDKIAYGCTGADGDGKLTWIPLTSLDSQFNLVYNGTITNIKNNPIDNSFNLLLEYKLYTYKDGIWLTDDQIGISGTGASAEIFNHPSNRAEGIAAHAEGYLTNALKNYTHTEGYSTTADGRCSHAEGADTFATGDNSHAEGIHTTAEGSSAHAEGYDTHATANFAHSEGENTYATQDAAHAEGYGTTASGYYAHAEGQETKATGNYTHSEGINSEAGGVASHAEGYMTYAGCTNGMYSDLRGGEHAEGYKTKATGRMSHAEGWESEAQGQASHAEGYQSIAEGSKSHAGGHASVAHGDFSFAHGFHAVANEEDQVVFGRYNQENADALFIIGNGTSESDTSNAFYVTSDGAYTANGKLITASHTQAASSINKMTGYSKPASTSAIKTTDTLNSAIGKLEKALDGKAATSHGTHVTFDDTNKPKADGTAAVGSASTVSRSDHVHPLQTTVSGNAGTATKFASAQSVALTGDVTGSASSQAGWSIETTLADSGVTAGTYGPSANVTGNDGATISIPQITVDSKGRVTSITARTYTSKNTADTDTHWTTKLYATGSSGTANAATANGATYLRLFDNSTARSSINIKGTGATTVTSDANGVITINSTDNNTVYTHPSYTATTGVPTANATPGFGGTFKVNQISSDGTGHVTANTARTITIPSTLSNGTGTAGLIKTTSTVTSNSGYTACPVISGVPYYKNTTYSFTNKAATLAWGTSTTIATVGGTNITATLPADPTLTWGTF